MSSGSQEACARLESKSFGSLCFWSGSKSLSPAWWVEGIPQTPTQQHGMPELSACHLMVTVVTVGRRLSAVWLLQCLCLSFLKAQLRKSLRPMAKFFSFIFFSAFSFHLISQFRDTPYRQPFKYTPYEYAVRICSCKCVFWLDRCIWI